MIATTAPNAANESPVLASMLGFFTGEPTQPIELESEPICTHYCFEGPELDD